MQSPYSRTPLRRAKGLTRQPSRPTMLRNMNTVSACKSLLWSFVNQGPKICRLAFRRRAQRLCEGSGKLQERCMQLYACRKAGSRIFSPSHDVNRCESQDGIDHTSPWQERTVPKLPSTRSVGCSFRKSLQQEPPDLAIRCRLS